MGNKKRRRHNRNRLYRPQTLSYSGPTKISAPTVVIDESLAWFPIWTKPRHEREVEIRLRNAGFATFIPSEAVLQTRRGTVRPVERVAVGRYLFLGLDKQSPQIAEAANAMRRLNERGGEEVLGRFLTAMEERLRVPASDLQGYADELSGRTVTIKGGAFSRLMAIMAQADEARARERGPFWSGEAA